ncbi:MAG: hypothetical protein NC394_09145 [Bacteroides sp.]|nr:hypothetical protein [Bacteroides sp.]
MLSEVSIRTKNFDLSYAANIVRESKKFEDYLAEAGSNAKAQSAASSAAVEKAIISMQKQVGVYDPHCKTDLKIPDHWVTEDSDKLGVKAAADFLRENGIEIRDTIPTHHITDEQMEWLKSRHDFSNMELHLDTPECQNFYGDLIVLGVCTFDEIKKLFAVQMPESGVLRQVNPSDLGINGLGIGTGLSSLKQTFEYTFDMQKAILSAFMDSMGNKRTSALNGVDQRFVQSTSELLSKKQELYDLLLGLFE